jgi:hypothetical protein
VHIALVRHGRPLAARNPIVTASGFARWARAYEKSAISEDSAPPQSLRRSFQDYYVVASSRPRSVHSAQVCLGRDPDVCLEDLCEMDIPWFRIPLRIPAYAWLALNRAIWMLGARGPFESFGEAKARAQTVSLELDRLALVHESVVVFGHGLMNQHVAAGLVTRGWRGTPRRTGYWNVIHLRKVQ